MAGLDFTEHKDVIHSEIERQARRLRCRHGLPADELDDVRQDLIVDLLSRAPAYDERKSGASTFVAMVASNRAALLGRRYFRDRCLFGRTPISLDDPIADDDGRTVRRGDLVAEADGYATWMGQDCDPYLDAARRLDLGAAADQLPADLRALCRALSADTAVGVCRSQDRSRADFYRRLREVRLRLRMAGLTGSA